MTYRSKFEAHLSTVLNQFGQYESKKLSYTIPESQHSYTADWCIGDNLFIESKGRLTIQDRKKMCLIKQQHPDKRFVFVFQRSSEKITKHSKVTYKMWAIKNGFEVVEPEHLLKFLEKQKI